MNYLACDLGAESGRLMLGELADGRLKLTEWHRFPNVTRKSGDSLHWDIDGLLAQIVAGLREAGRRGVPLAGFSTDSWGVDYLLFDAAGRVMPPAFHYRDPRGPRGMAAAEARVPYREIFAESGIQRMPLNTLYQLAAESPDRLAEAHRLLLVGDGVQYWLTGVARAEESLASTSMLFNPVTRRWSDRLLTSLELPARLFPEVVPSGTRLGRLRPELAVEAGLGDLEVIASCSHDTGAAVAGVPAEGDDWAFLSSGTWSLLGRELPAPILTDRCREFNFTNELGHGGTVRLLKNLSGLWLVQECRRHWAAAGRDLDYSTLTLLAAGAEPFRSLIQPADPRFLAPGDMPGRITAFCRETGQPVPASPGEFIRCALESLALLYRHTLGQLVELTGRECRRLHIVGGGSRNDLLNQFAASATRTRVVAGPVEATAAGNVLVQAIALGELPDLAAARAVLRRSFAVAEYAPADGPAWDAAARRFAAWV